jgi:hypothetical protein
MILLKGFKIILFTNLINPDSIINLYISVITTNISQLIGDYLGAYTYDYLPAFAYQLALL